MIAMPIWIRKEDLVSARGGEAYQMEYLVY